MVEDGEAGEVEGEEQILIAHSVKEALDLARGDAIADRRMAAQEICRDSARSIFPAGFIE